MAPCTEYLQQEREKCSVPSEVCREGEECEGGMYKMFQCVKLKIGILHFFRGSRKHWNDRANLHVYEYA